MEKTIALPPDSIVGLHYDGVRDSAVAALGPDGALLFACSLERLSRQKQDGSWPAALLSLVPWAHVASVACAAEGSPPESVSLPAPVCCVSRLESHGAAAFWPSGFEEAFVLVCETAGPFWGGLARASRSKGMTWLRRWTWEEAGFIGARSAFVTRSCGFTPHKHEGKITGLAAFGSPSSEARAWLSQVTREEQTLPPLSVPRETLAATLQAMTEESVAALLGDAGQEGLPLCLSGSLFSNVKLNQKLKALGFPKIYISPPMGDEGTAYGAALHVWTTQHGAPVWQKPTMRVGFAYSESDVRACLNESGVAYEESKPSQAAETLAALLAQGGTVGFFSGPMEFGPRALGGRSILASAEEPSIHTRLNEKLKRTEFMPFAPITRIEDAAFCYEDLTGAELAASFMTITTACTALMREKCPAVVHVDGTARPQLVEASSQPLLHALLTAYREKTGAPALINTSFNIHEEPIVCSPADALRTFRAAGLDALFFDVGNGLFVR